MDSAFKVFYTRVLEWQHHAIPFLTPKKVYFEFGSAPKNTLISYIEAVQEFCKKYNYPISEFIIYAFDSFSGLPPIEKGDEHIHWHKGQFACSKELLIQNIKVIGFPMENVHLVEGYYENTLTPQLWKELKDKKISPSLVNIDCDLYSSTKTAMDWLVPLLSSGCFFYFDDFWSFHGNPDLGELKYINEFNKSDKGHLEIHNQFFPYNQAGPEMCGQVFMFSRKEWEWLK